MVKANKVKDNGVKEIARRAGVSIATVDRVIHDRPGVSAGTRQTILQIIKDLDYQPNLIARRLASGAVIRIAVLIPKVSQDTDFWSAPLRGIERAATEIKAYGVQFDYYLFDLDDRASFADMASNVLSSEVNGVIMVPSFVEEVKEFSSRCQSANIPLVFIDTNIPDQKILSYIGPPLAESGFLAARLCDYDQASSGEILIVNLARTTDNYSYRLIEKGFRDYFSSETPRAIHKVDIHDADPHTVEESILAEMKKYAALSAIFVCNSRAFVVAKALDKLTPNPKPMLIGFDFLTENIRWLREGVIDFLICHQSEHQGYLSVQALYQWLALGKKPPKIDLMPMDIVIRENEPFYRN